MAVAVTMPKLGLTMSSGNIAQWRKKEGDSVAKGEILFVVATDKLTFDVEAQETGILIQILVPEGKDVPVGETLAYLGEKGEHVKASAEKPGSSVGAVENPAKSPSAPFTEKTASSSTAGRVSASPLAKKTARESGLSLSGLKGTGPGRERRTCRRDSCISGRKGRACKSVCGKARFLSRRRRESRKKPECALHRKNCVVFHSRQSVRFSSGEKDGPRKRTLSFRPEGDRPRRNDRP